MECDICFECFEKDHFVESFKCTHTFCKNCDENMKKYFHPCPLCRARRKKPIIAFKIDMDADGMFVIHANSRDSNYEFIHQIVQQILMNSLTNTRTDL